MLAQSLISVFLAIPTSASIPTDIFWQQKTTTMSTFPSFTTSVSQEWSYNIQARRLQLCIMPDRDVKYLVGSSLVLQKKANYMNIDPVLSEIFDTIKKKSVKQSLTVV